MKRACAWCGKELPPNDLPPAPDLPPDAASHGMCEQCKEQLAAQRSPEPAPAAETATDLLGQFIVMLEEAVCHAGTDTARCEFCGRTHGDPVKDSEAPDPGVSVGQLGGMTYVYGCRCEHFRRYARFLYYNRRVVLKAYKMLAVELRLSATEIEGAPDAGS